MRVTIEGITTPQFWRLGGATAELRIYANQSFQTSDGTWVPQGTPGSQNTFYQAFTCTIIGNVLTIPTIELDSTVDALTNPFATYTAEIVAHNNKRVPWLASFPLNTLPDGDPSTTWGEIQLTKEGYNPQAINDPLIYQLLGYIQLAVGNLNKASETNTGGVAITEDGPDPSFPIAVSAHDPVWLALSAAGVNQPWIDAADHNAVGDAVKIEDATIALGTPNTLTSASSAFTQLPLGKTIAIPGAGPAGATLITTISAVPDGTTLSLADAATTAVTNTRAVYGTENTAAIQAALTAASTSNRTNTVLLKRGNYLCTGSLTFPQGVALQGAWAISPDQLGHRYVNEPEPMDSLGTTLVVVGGEGSAAGRFIMLNSSSALKGVSLFWPAQLASLVTPKLYPWAVEMFGAGPVVENVELVNPYQGIYSHIGHRHRVSNVKGTPILTGLYASQQLESSIYQSINFTPIYTFSTTELPPYPMTPLMQWIHQNATAFKAGRNDNSQFTQCFSFGYFTGFHIMVDTAEATTFANGSGAPGGKCWAQFTDCGADGSSRPAYIEDMQGNDVTGAMGLTFTNCVFNAAQWFPFAGPALNAVHVTGTATGRVGLVNCRFHLGNRLVVCEGNARVNISACFFQDWTVSPIVMSAGTGTVNGCLFKIGSAMPAVVTTGSPWLAVTGNMFEYQDHLVFSISATTDFSEAGNAYSDSPLLVTPALGSGWANFGAGQRNVAYKKQDGWVQLQGVIAGGTTGTLFTLPAGFRPTGHSQFTVANNTSLATISVQSDGQVAIVAINNNISLSLDQVRFAVR